MIKHFNFYHGFMYKYRLHTQKLKSLCKNNSLSSFLLNVPEICPNHHFTQGPRASTMKKEINADVFQIQGHEISALAGFATKYGEKRKAHELVESLFIERDKSTVSTEIPVWMENSESNFGVDGVLTGHIDLLRIENNKIWVWDYKPKAEKEKYAATQTFLYASMLSKRTNTPMNNFGCGYFDENSAFIFDPTKAKLN